jgi:hypothetical protein
MWLELFGGIGRRRFECGRLRMGAPMLRQCRGQSKRSRSASIGVEASAGAELERIASGIEEKRRPEADRGPTNPPLWPSFGPCAAMGPL